MKALLLAAGYGTRLHPITKDTPKCLVDICGKPLLAYWLELLTEFGCTEILINLHHLADQVKSYINKSSYKKYVTLVHEEQLLGTGGTLLKNRDFFEDDTIFLIHADNFSSFSLQDFSSAHKSRPTEAEFTMMTFRTDTPQQCGIVELDQDGILIGFHEKVKNPPGNLANAAVFLLEESIFSHLDSMEKKVMDFSKEVIPYFLGKIFTWENKVYHRDIGTVDSLELARRYITLQAK